MPLVPFVPPLDDADAAYSAAVTARDRARLALDRAIGDSTDLQYARKGPRSAADALYLAVYSPSADGWVSEAADRRIVAALHMLLAADLAVDAAAQDLTIAINNQEG